MKKKFICISISVLCAFFFVEACYGKSLSPMDYTKKKVEAVFQVLQDYPVAGPPENLPKRREAIRNIIDQSFDSLEMSKRAVGKYWKEQEEGKQKEFVQLFYWRLYNFYILRLETYSDEKVVYLNEKIMGDKSAVFTRVSSKRYPEFDIEYRLKKNGDSWKIYDLVIEGVSLVANYRSQFNNFLTNKSFDELLKALKEKAPDNALK